MRQRGPKKKTKEQQDPAAAAEAEAKRRASADEAVRAIQSDSPILDLAGQLLEDREAVKISTALWENEHVKMLDMSHNSVACEGASALGRVLKGPQVLQVLDLSYNCIEDRGAEELAAGVADSKALEQLDLSFNSLTSTGIERIAEAVSRTGIRSLGLGGNSSGFKGAQGISKMLRANTTLKILQVFRMGLGCQGAAEIARALSSSGSALKELNLNRNGIGDDGAQALSQMLRSNTCLKDLMLEHNSIRQAGGIDIANSLLENSTLCTLLLAENPLSPGSIARFAKVLEENNGMRRLNFSAQNIPYEVSEALQRAQRRRLQQDVKIGERMAHSTEVQRAGGKVTLPPPSPPWKGVQQIESPAPPRDDKSDDGDDKSDASDAARPAAATPPPRGALQEDDLNRYASPIEAPPTLAPPMKAFQVEFFNEFEDDDNLGNTSNIAKV